MALLHTRIVDFYDHLSGTYVRETTHTFSPALVAVVWAWAYIVSWHAASS